MISKEEFLDKAEKLIFPHLEQLKKKRNKISLLQISVVGGFALMWLCITLFSGAIHFFIFGCIAFPFMIASSCYILTKYEIKKRFLKPIFAMLGNAQETTTPPKLNDNYLCSKFLLPSRYVSDRSEPDPFAGKRDGSFKFFSNNTDFIVKDVDTLSVFFRHRVAIQFQLPKKVLHPILILERKGSLSRINSKQVKMQKVTIEDIQFNKAYNIFANDQIKVRTILTPAMIERLKKIKEVYHAYANLRFENYRLLLVLEPRNFFYDPFEFFEFFNILNRNKLAKFYDEIQSLYEFENILKLK